MLIACPNCATSYQIEAASLGAAGRSVRCVRCKNTWFATNTAAMAAIAQAHRQEVAQFTAATSVGDIVTAPAAAPPPDLPVIVDAPSIEPAAEEEHPVSDEPPPLVDEPPPADDPPHDGAPAPEPDIVAAEPEPEPAPSEAAPAIDSVPVPSEDIETVAARRLRRQSARRRTHRFVPGLTTAILGLLALNIGLIGWRGDVVRWLPQTASLYARIGLPVNLRGLVFTDIVTRKDTQDGVHVLIVEGFIRNETRNSAQVPRLRFAVRNQSGHELYSWTAQPARNAIPAGSTLPFRSRLASPPTETHEILVRFFNRRDLVAGLQ